MSHERDDLRVPRATNSPGMRDVTVPDSNSSSIVGLIQPTFQTEHIPHPSLPTGNHHSFLPHHVQQPLLRPSQFGFNPFPYSIPFTVTSNPGHWVTTNNPFGMSSCFPPPTGLHGYNTYPLSHEIAPYSQNEQFFPRATENIAPPIKVEVSFKKPPSFHNTSFDSSPSTTPICPPGVTPLPKSKTDDPAYSPFSANFQNLTTQSSPSTTSPATPRTISPTASSTPISTDTEDDSNNLAASGNTGFPIYSRQRKRLLKDHSGFFESLPKQPPSGSKFVSSFDGPEQKRSKQYKRKTKTVFPQIVFSQDPPSSNPSNAKSPLPNTSGRVKNITSLDANRRVEEHGELLFRNVSHPEASTPRTDNIRLASRNTNLISVIQSSAPKRLLQTSQPLTSITRSRSTAVIRTTPPSATITREELLSRFGITSKSQEASQSLIREAATLRTQEVSSSPSLRQELDQMSPMFGNSPTERRQINQNDLSKALAAVTQTTSANNSFLNESTSSALESTGMSRKDRNSSSERSPSNSRNRSAVSAQTGPSTRDAEVNTSFHFSPDMARKRPTKSPSERMSSRFSVNDTTETRNTPEARASMEDERTVFAKDNFNMNFVTPDQNVKAGSKIPYKPSSRAPPKASNMVFNFNDLTTPNVFKPTVNTPNIAPQEFNLADLGYDIGYVKGNPTSTGQLSTENVDIVINPEVGLAIFEECPWIDQTRPFLGPEEFRSLTDGMRVSHLFMPGWLATAMPKTLGAKIGFAMRPKNLHQNDEALVVCRSSAFKISRPVKPNDASSPVSRCQICEGILATTEHVAVFSFIMRRNDSLGKKALYKTVETLSCYNHFEHESAINTGINVFRKNKKGSVERFWRDYPFSITGNN